MSCEMMARVERYAPVRGGDLSLLLKVADQGDEISSFRIETLARALRITPKAAEKVLARLKRRGILSEVPDAEIPIAWREPGVQFVRICVEAPPPGALLH